MIEEVQIAGTTGALPLEVSASAKVLDREGDALSFHWDFGNGETMDTKVPEVAYSYEKPGAYTLQLTVTDSEGEATRSERRSIVAGNARPVVDINVEGGTPAFYIPGQEIGYTVNVTDADAAPGIDMENIFVSVDYLEGMDKVAMNMGHQQVSAAVTGKALTQGMDCKTCHKEIGASIGPSYTDVSKKYKDQKDMVSYLQKKIVSGGSGVWGEVMMPAHPKVTADESRQMALYIQSLTAGDQVKKSLPSKGVITAAPTAPGNVMVITASYTDNGTEGTVPLTGTKTLAIASNTLNFTPGMEKEGLQEIAFNGMDLYLTAGDQGWLKLPKMDLSAVSSITLAAGWQEAPSARYSFEARANGPDGPVVGAGSAHGSSRTTRWGRGSPDFQKTQCL